MSTKRQFIHLSRAWYGPAALRGQGFRDEVMFGLLFDDGSTEGEIAVRWYDIPAPCGQAARLEAFDDSWQVLGQLQDVVAAMAALPHQTRSCISPERFGQLLDACGFEDATPTQAAKEDTRVDKVSERGIDSRVA